MKKKILPALLFIFFSTAVVAQQSNWKPWIMPEAGIVAGAMHPSVELRITMGMSRTGWQVGAGVGVDGYLEESFPLFMQVRRQLHWRKWHPFVFLGTGYNLRSGTDTFPTWTGNRVLTYHGGLFAEGGLGLAFLVKRKERLFLSLVQSYKRSSVTYQEMIWNGPTPFIRVPSTEIQRMFRVGVRVGWRIGK